MQQKIEGWGSHLPVGLCGMFLVPHLLGLENRFIHRKRQKPSQQYRQLFYQDAFDIELHQEVRPPSTARLKQLFECTTFFLEIGRAWPTSHWS